MLQAVSTIISTTTRKGSIRMKRLCAIMFFVLVLGIQAVAQVDYSFGNIKKKRTRQNVMTVGLKGGFTSYSMHFSNLAYNKLSGERVNDLGFGVYCEYPVSNISGLAIGGEVLAIHRGVTKDFLFRKQYREIDKIDVSCVDLRIPVTYYFKPKKKWSPYVFIAADIAYCYAGEVSKSYPDNEELGSYSIDITKSDAVLNPVDFSAIIGGGMRYRVNFRVFSLVFKLDASYNFGIINTYPSDRGTPIELYAYTFDKKERRTNRGFELMFSLGLPLKFNTGHDSCWGW